MASDGGAACQPLLPPSSSPSSTQENTVADTEHEFPILSNSSRIEPAEKIPEGQSFKGTPAWNLRIDEAAASISAGLHHRKFLRRPGTSFSRGPHSVVRVLQRYNKSRKCMERLVHQSRWRYFYMMITICNLSLAIFEPPSVRLSSMHTETSIILILLEILMSLFYGFDLFMRWYAGEDVLQDFWARGRISIIICILCNSILSMITSIPNFSRILRPFLFIERLRNVRKIAASIFGTIPKIFQVLLLLSFHVMFGGVFAHTLFAGITGTADTLGNNEGAISNCNFLNGGISLSQNSTSVNNTSSTQIACSTFSKTGVDGLPCTNYFETIWTSMMHLFILITTANFPDIMIPVYDCSRWASIFFVVYIVLGLYFLLTLILAVVYTHFSRRNKEMIASMVDERMESLGHSFILMSDLTRQDMAERNGEVIDDVDLYSPMMLEDRFVSIDVWVAVLKVYRPTFALSLSESLFSMYAGAADGIMKFEEFCGAIDHTRLRIREKKKRKSRRSNVGTVAHLGIQSQRSQTEEKADNSFSHKMHKDMSNASRCLKFRIRHSLSGYVWDGIMDFLVGANTIMLLLRLTPKLFTTAQSEFIDMVTNIILVIFLVEVSLKIFALGFLTFWRLSIFNRIDFVTVMGSALSTFLFWFEILPDDNRRIADFFLLLRTLRTVRLLRMNTEFRIISASVVEIAPALLRYLAVLVALLYFFAVMGMEFFAGTLRKECYPEEAAILCEKRSRRLEKSSYGVNNYWNMNFDSLSNAFVSLFYLCVVNQWPVLMEGAVAAFDSQWPRMYFILFWICCVVIVMNVLTAFLIDAYQANVETVTQRMKADDENIRRRLKSHLSSLSTTSMDSVVNNDGLNHVRLSSWNSFSNIMDDKKARRKRVNRINRNWARILKQESLKLGHDISHLDIRLEKGAGNFYSELYG